MSHVFTTRRPSPASPGALAALDFGLRVRVEALRLSARSSRPLELRDRGSLAALHVADLCAKEVPYYLSEVTRPPGLILAAQAPRGDAELRRTR